MLLLQEQYEHKINTCFFLLMKDTIEDIEVELGGFNDPLVVGANLLASRFVSSAIEEEKVLHVFRCDERLGVLLQNSDLLCDSKPTGAELLSPKKALIDSKVLPAVGVLFVMYPKHDHTVHGTAFVSSAPSSGKQRILTAFHNVRPKKFTSREGWEWPTVIFSTYSIGSANSYLQWKEDGEPNDSYVSASFSLPLLKKWQGCEEFEHPTFRYSPDNEHDLIELEVPAIFPKHLNLNRNAVPFTPSPVICIGYPGEHALPSYQSLPNYADVAALRAFKSEMKTLSWGYLESVVGTLARHSCSTTVQHSGSPIIFIEDLVEGEGVPTVSCVHVCKPFATKYAGIGIYKTYWI